jgi:cell division initiation protein
MTLTALDIQQQRFGRRLRGLAPKEVEAFLGQAAADFETLQRENHRLAEEVKRLQADTEAYQRREGTFKLALVHSQKVIDQMQSAARKQAELVVAEAETRAAKLLNQAQRRLIRLQEDIAELRRQRVQIEVEIGAVIESHRRLLAVGRQAMQEMDANDGKLKVLPPPD